MLSILKDVAVAVIGGCLGVIGTWLLERVKERRSTSLLFDFDDQILTST